MTKDDSPFSRVPDTLEGIVEEKPVLRSIASEETTRIEETLDLQMRLLVRHIKTGAPREKTERALMDFATEYSDLSSAIEQLKKENLDLLLQNQELRDQTLKDSFTKIYNKAFFEHELARYVHDANASFADGNRRTGARAGSVCLLMADIDHFKSVNDTYGHGVGDRVITDVVQKIREGVRKTDHVCRYGGEEFAVIFPISEYHPAEEIERRIYRKADTIRRDVEAHVSVGEGDKRRAVTISIGIAAFQPEYTHTAEFLKSSADEALYKSKANGRNRISCNEYVHENSINFIEPNGFKRFIRSVMSRLGV